ncbi:MAG: VWA domain-containing protein [Acidobacteriota bacterium]
MSIASVASAQSPEAETAVPASLASQAVDPPANASAPGSQTLAAPTEPSAEKGKEEAEEDSAAAEKPAAEPLADSAPAPLSLRHSRWLASIDPLIDEEERTVFLKLTRDYQRDAFIRRFWEVRDPFPRTSRNELKERWERNLELAKQLYGDFLGVEGDTELDVEDLLAGGDGIVEADPAEITAAALEELAELSEDSEEAEEAREAARAEREANRDDRGVMLLFLDEPEDKKEIHCRQLLKPLEIWYYPGTPTLRGSFYVVFYRQRRVADDPTKGIYKLWYPSRDGLQPLIDNFVSVRASDRDVLATAANTCVRGGEVVEALQQSIDWGQVEEEGLAAPDPGPEWVRSFVAFSTDLPPGAEVFPAEVAVDYPGRYQSRTLVQGLVTVDQDEVQLSDLEQSPSYNFVLDGEILKGDELFEHFRYRFHFGPEDQEQIPIVFQRYLRPGDYSLVLKVQDLHGERFYRQQIPLQVPYIDAAELARRQAQAELDAAKLAQAAPAAVPEGGVQIKGLLSEANRDLATGDTQLKLFAPQTALMTGRVRVEALAEGPGVDRVRFYLNGKAVFSKTRPPFSVEINLGEEPRTHVLRAVAETKSKEVLAQDELVLNAGPHRFAVRLIEPQRGRTYQRSLRAQAIVEVPEGERLDRVEFYLNRQLLATLYQPPFIQPLIVPEGKDASYVRAAAFLVDGAGMAEDAVFLNVPDYVDQVDVQLVELYTSVLDRRGRPVRDLTADRFTVVEEGKPQDIARFELVDDLPVHVGVILDTSTSMLTRLDNAVTGALQFFETVLTPRDRAAVITFNETPNLAVRFTNSREVLAGGLAGLTAEGETALYDAMVYGLYYFSGISGKRAIILLSDGEDVASRYSFDDVINYARRTGVSIYSVGIDLSGRSTDIRLKLQKLAGDTGGRSFFIDDARDLDRVYDSIQEELRSQYLVAYQSNNEGDGYRQVEIEVEGSGLSVNAQSGYFP